MQSVIFLLMAAIHFVFFFLAVRLFLQRRSIFTGIVCLVVLGLAWDNLTVGLGATLGEGGLLRGLNSGRYAMHALFTPLLIMFAASTARRVGIGWANNKVVLSFLGLLTVAMIALGVWDDIVQLELAPVSEAGTFRYINASTAGPPIPAIVTIVVMIVVGAFIWRKHKWAVLCLGAILMFIAAGAGASILLLANAGEILFAGSIIWTDYKLSGLTPGVAPDVRAVRAAS